MPTGIDLEQAMKDGASIFQMPPAESQGNGAPQAGVKPEAGELPAAGVKPEAGELPAAGVKPEVGELPASGVKPEVGELPASGAKPEAGELPAAGAKPEAGSPAPSPRFKTHDDAEKGYTALQSRTTKTEQENAELRRQLASYQAEQAEKAKQNKQGEIRQFAVTKNKEALAAINQLNPESSDHDQRVAEIWAEANMAVDDFRMSKQEPSPPPAAGQPPAGNDNDAGDDSSALVTGMLDAENFSEAERIAFWGLSRSAPTHGPDGAKLTLQQQISMTMEKARQHNAAQRSQLMQELNLPLERGGSYSGPAPGEDARQYANRQLSLDDAMQEADRGRTLA